VFGKTFSDKDKRGRLKTDDAALIHWFAGQYAVFED
jgi:hypothetical protein